MATTDIIEAVKNVYAENRTKETFEDWMDRFNRQREIQIFPVLYVSYDGRGRGHYAKKNGGVAQ